MLARALLLPRGGLAAQRRDRALQPFSRLSEIGADLLLKRVGVLRRPAANHGPRELDLVAHALIPDAVRCLTQLPCRFWLLAARVTRQPVGIGLEPLDFARHLVLFPIQPIQPLRPVSAGGPLALTDLASDALLALFQLARTVSQRFDAIGESARTCVLNLSRGAL